MSKITDLSHGQAVQRLTSIRESLEELGRRDELTEDDERSFDEKTAEFAEVDAHRKQLERTSALARVRASATTATRSPAALKVTSGSTGGDYDADPILNPDSVEDKRFRNPFDLSGVNTFSRSREDITAELKARSLSAVEKMRGANDRIRSTATDILENCDDSSGTLARMVLATASPEYLRGWSKLASNRGHLVTPEERAALERAMSLTDNAGGYLVPFQMDPTVILTSAGSSNQIRQIARSVVATGDVWHGVSAGEVTWGWAAEAAQASDNSPTLAQPSIAVHKAHGFVPISYEALQDAANVTQEVGKLLAHGKDTLENVAFISGSGTGQPLGLVTALDAASGVDVQVADADALAAGDVYALDNALASRHRGNSSFLGNRVTYNALRAIDTAGGGQMFGRISEAAPETLLGRPKYEAEAMAHVGTTGSESNGSATDTALVYGDFENFVIVDRIGMSVELIQNLMGANQRPTGQRGWYAHYRVGSGVTNSDAFRQLKG